MNDTNLISTIVLKNYLRQILLSSKRKTVYYIWNPDKGKFKKKLPKKYQDFTLFGPGPLMGSKRKITVLINKKTGFPIVANPESEGKPNLKVISGQAIWKAQTKSWDRAKIMEEVKAQLTEVVKDMTPITDFPIRIEAELHDVVDDSLSGKGWDIDNRFIIWQKAFLDVLVGNRVKVEEGGKKVVRPTTKVIIPNDNIFYVTQPPVAKFIPINPGEDRKIVFKIYKETDPRIIDNNLYVKHREASTTKESKGLK
jgi:hypothetical protein